MVTLFRSSIEYDIQSVYKLEPGLGLCHTYNLVVDNHQKATYSAQLKADSGSGVTRTKKSYVGESLTKFWLRTSVGETDYDSGVTWRNKKQATWGKPLQNVGCSLQLVKLTLIME